MRSKRLLFFSTQPDLWGGSEELWSQAAARLAASAEFEVIAWVKWWKSPHPKVVALKEKGVTLKLWGKTSIGALPMRAVGKFSGRNEFDRGLQMINPDLVIVSNGAVMPTSYIVTSLMNSLSPYINIAQANNPFLFYPDAEANINRTYIEKARRSIFVSKENLMLTQLQLSTTLQNASVVRNPFNVPYGSTPYERFFAQADEAIKFACVARLHPASKGQDILLQVLSQQRWRNRDWSLSFFGEGPNAECLQRLVRLFGLDEKVRFEGHVPNISEVWRNHHALVLPSRYEGLPIAIVEAMLCGRVVITTNAGGNAEVVEDGRSGFIAPAPTPELFDKAMERAWSARSDWARVGLDAQRSIRALVPPIPFRISAS